MILVDFSPVAISCAFRDVGDGMKPDKEQFRDMIFNALATISTKWKDKYGEIVICMDEKPYWREEIFPYYKKNRKPMTGDVHWDVVDEVKEVLNTRIPWKIISIQGAEADDIIGTLIHEFAPRSPRKFLIISPDGDFKQLQCYPNVDQIDIIHGKELKEADARMFLEEQIVCGQKKDAIPNILSDEDTMVNPDKRQKPMTAKKKAAWIGNDPSFFCEGDMMKRYRLNKRLIDLSKVPDDVKKDILYSYALAPTSIEGTVREYFISQRMAELADQANAFS